MKFAGLATLFLLTAMLMLPDAQAETTNRYAFSSGNWKGRIYFRDKNFSHCQMSAKYRSGSKLIFGLEPDKSMSIGVVNPLWNMRPGDTKAVSISVDRRSIVWSTVKVLKPNHIAAFFKANTQTYRRLRNGRSLAIHAGGTTLKYSLLGTSRALIKLLNCTISGIKMKRFASPTPASPFKSKPPASKGKRNAFKTGNWKGGAYYKKGRFTHCAMSVKYKSGSELILGLERNKSMSIGVSHPKWSMTKGNKVPVQFLVDGKPALRSTARVISPTHYAAFFKTNLAVFEMIRSGELLGIGFGSTTQKFSLIDGDEALKRLLKCNVEAMNAEKPVSAVAPANPFSSTPKKAPPSNPFSNKKSTPPPKQPKIKQSNEI